LPHFSARYRSAARTLLVADVPAIGVWERAMDQNAEFYAPERVLCGSAEGEIDAIKHERGFLGCWKCSTCKQFGVSAATYWNRSTALAWARAAVTSHAESCHLANEKGRSAASQ
jgi:hypothetical protein